MDSFALCFQKLVVPGDQGRDGIDVLQERTNDPQAEEVIDCRDAARVVGDVHLAKLVIISLETFDAELDGRCKTLLLKDLTDILNQQVQAGLVLQERHGREIISRVDYESMHELVGFLTEECCTGVEINRNSNAA